MPLRGIFYPAGFPLEITTNSSAVIAAGAESWSHYGQVSKRKPIRLRVLVEDGPGEPAPQPVFRLQSGLAAIISDRRHFATCDLGARFGWCLVSGQMLADKAWFRWHFLEAMAYTLLAQQDLTPVHAACVALHGRGVLLCGASGAGKSTLAFACGRGGWTYLGDDATLLLQGSKAREAVGKPHQFRLRPEAAKLFPELKRYAARVLPNGKTALEFAPSAFPEIATRCRCRVDRFVFLNRSEDAAPAARLLEPETAVGRLLRDLPNYGDRVRRRHAETVRQLGVVPAYELRYGKLADGVALLEQCMRP